MLFHHYERKRAEGRETSLGPGWGEPLGMARDAERCHGNGERYPAPHEDVMGMVGCENAPLLPQTFKKPLFGTLFLSTLFRKVLSINRAITSLPTSTLHSLPAFNLSTLCMPDTEEKKEREREFKDKDILKRM